MARFGLLMQNNCIWNNDTLLYDTSYVQQMTKTSQSLNLSYGYLWWLNGKSSYMLPTSQIVFPGSYAPAAPSDMFAGLGKNGQIVSVSKRLGLVVVRMGNQATSGEVPTQLCNTIWEKLNSVMCNLTSINETLPNTTTVSIFPNPANSEINIEGLNKNENNTIQIFDVQGKLVITKTITEKGTIDLSELNKGVYVIKIGEVAQRIVKM